MQKKEKTVVEKMVYRYIAKHPGARAEEVRCVIGYPPEDIGRALRRLRDGGHLRVRGTTRWTTYTVTAKTLA